MIRRGLTVMAWLAGLAALTYTDVVAPLAQRALGVEVVDERVEDQEPWHLDSVGEAVVLPTKGSCESATALGVLRAGRT